VLSRRLAGRGHYPAIDLLQSISRLMPELATTEHQQAAQLIRELLSVYDDHEDLISIGAYRGGTNPLVDTAIAMKPQIDQFLRQGIDETTPPHDARQALVALVQQCLQRKDNRKEPTTPAN